MKITRGKVRGAQKIVLYAPEGVGKTTFASKFPEPLFMDTEDGSSHLDVARLERPTSMSMVGKQLEFVRTTKPCKTLVIDTVDWLEILITQHVCSLYNVDSIEKAAGSYGKGYTEVAENMGRVLDILSDIVDAGIHVVLLCHTEVKRHEDPMEMGSYDRYQLKLGKKSGSLVKEWADMVLFARHNVNVVNIDNKGEIKGKNKAVSDGKRIMFTSHSPAFDAKNRHGLPSEVPFDFSSIAEHIYTDLMEVVPHVEDEPVSAPVPVAQPVKEVVTEVVPKVVNADPVEKVTPLPTKEEDLSKVPKAVVDLLTSHEVKLFEVLEVMISKGVIAKNTPFENIPEATVNGLIIAGWDKLFGFVKEWRNKQAELFINSDESTF